MVIKDSLNNIVNSTVHVNLPREHIVPTLLSSLVGNDNLIGRKKELQEIDTLLNDSNTLLIKGIGGVGKSTLAKHYFHNQKSKYDYYGFFEGLELFITKLKITLNLQQEKEEELFMEALVQLQRLDGKKLIIIDKLENIYDNEKKLEQILALEEYGYKILLISRFRVKNVETLSLESLTPEDGLLLFTNHYKTDEIDKANQIIKYLDYHALFVELVAKTINMEEDSSLDEIIEKFELGELSKIEYRNEDNGDKTLFNQNLTTLFKIQKKSLKDEYLLLLKQLSILPSIDIELSFLEEIFAKKIKSRLNFLVSQGWLIGDGESYKLHQIIKEYLLSNHLPTFEEIEFQVDFFFKRIETDDVLMAITNRNRIVFFESLWNILDIIKVKHLKIIKYFLSLGNLYHIMLGDYVNSGLLYAQAGQMSQKLLGESNLTAEAYTNMGIAFIALGQLDKQTETFLIASIDIKEKLMKRGEAVNVVTSYNNLASFYKAVGNYSKSEVFYSKSMYINKEAFGEKNLDTATSYNNLAEIYRCMGYSFYDKAELLYLDALKIKKSLLGDIHPDIAIIYNNLALLYTEQGNNKKAENFYFESLNIQENVMGKEHPHILIALHNVAYFYEKIKNYILAEKFYLKVLRLKEKVLGTEHYDTANSYSNLSVVYSSMHMFKKAELMNEKALKIRKKIFGEEHPDMVTSYANKAICYAIKEDYEKAYEYSKKAVNIGIKVLPANHSNLISAKNDMEFFEAKLTTNLFEYNQKIGRNFPCLCNSGLKYKKCCGKN